MKLNQLKNYTLTFLFTGMMHVSFGQDNVTHPTPIDISNGYKQDFETLGTKFPEGWFGWNVAQASPWQPRVVPPIADLGNVRKATASTTDGAMYNYDGKLGFKSGNYSDNAIVVALNTKSVGDGKRVNVKFDAMVMRNLFNGTDNTMVNALALQYRIGTEGNFTNLGITVKNGANVQKLGSNPVDLQNFLFTLPEKCNNKDVVQLRWILKAVSGKNPATSEERPYFAIDNFEVETVAAP